MEFRPAFRRLVALAASFVLLPEGLLFLGLSAWKASRFVESLKDSGPPHWFFFSSSLFLLTASCFCFFSCRDLWRKAKALPKSEEEPELSDKSMVSSAVHRLSMLWLTAAFTICMFVLPLLLVTLGLLLDERNEVGWLIGIPVGLGTLIYFTILWRRKKSRS